MRHYSLHRSSKNSFFLEWKKQWTPTISPLHTSPYHMDTSRGISFYYYFAQIKLVQIFFIGNPMQSQTECYTNCPKPWSLVALWPFGCWFNRQIVTHTKKKCRSVRLHRRISGRDDDYGLWKLHFAIGIAMIAMIMQLLLDSSDPYLSGLSGPVWSERLCLYAL